MSDSKANQRPEPKIDVKRQVKQAQQLVREAARALTRLEQKTGVVLTPPRRARPVE
jgi:hypothetical protein